MPCTQLAAATRLGRRRVSPIDRFALLLLCLQDRDIGRVVVRLAGSVPTANSLRLPRCQQGSLGVLGRFLYLQLRLEPGQPYAIHADFAAADGSLHRVSVSNLYASGQAARMRRSGVQVFLPAAHGCWTLLALDLGSLARQACESPYAHLRTLHLCANMTLRGAFVSDVRYNWQVCCTFGWVFGKV